MTGFRNVKRIEPLGNLLIPVAGKRLLQQGWSPKCHDQERESENVWAVLKTTAIQPGRFEPAHHKVLPLALEPRPQIQVRELDLLITSAGPRARCGVTALVRNAPPRLMISGKMYRFRVNPEQLDPRFLELYLLSPEAQERINRMKTGISDSGLNLTNERFLRLPVPVPDLNTQHRTVEVAADHLDRLERASASIELAARQSVILKLGLHERLLSEPARDVSLGTLSLASGYGTSTKCRQDATGVPVVRIPNLQGGHVNLDDEKRAEEAVDLSGLMLVPGDVLFVRTNGSRDLIGRTAVVQGDVGASFASYLVRFQFDQSRVRPSWVHAVLESPSMRSGMQRLAASSAGQYNLGLKKLSGVRIPVPEISRQDRLLADLDVHMERTSAVGSVLANTHLQVDSTRRAVLKSAFDGNFGSENLHD